jgi:formylmethanofuran dehydrogenase subunit B
MNSNTGMLVSDVFMNNLASEDSHVLTGKDYKNIRALLKSTNKEDKAVGMSIMSNCNIQKSKTYLALLFFHFSETLRGEPMWNQVAFKSLRREFDKYCLEYNHYHSNRYSQCVQYLAEDGALTVNAAEHLITIMFDNVINQSTGINSDNNMFILDKASVKLAPVAKAKVKNDVDLSQIALDMQSDLPF